MIAVEPFAHPAIGSREYNAVKKATELRPEVIHLYDDDRDAFYLVKRRGGTSKYVVRVWQDADGQLFVECLCKAGFPPRLKETQLPAWEPGPCFHAAATLLFIAEKVSPKEQEKDVTSISNANA